MVIGGNTHERRQVYRSASRGECRERWLSLQAADIPCEILRDGRDYAVVVSVADVRRAATELEAYAREKNDASIDRDAVPAAGDGWRGVFGYAIVLLMVDSLHVRGAFGADWFARGEVVAGWVRDGQWWRTVTALTLHMDAPHLMGNLFFGGLFGLFAGQMIGSGLAWMGILLAGAMGNTINCWIQPPEHASLGASTAVFGALGLVSWISWAQRARTTPSRLARWTPVVGGVVLLGFTGTGGPQTDVSAHVAGFISGLVLGAGAVALTRRTAIGPRVQCLLGLAAVMVVAACWTIALRQ